MFKNLQQGRSFYKSALLLMLPMILQNFITNFMSLADTFMVGVLGEKALAAVTMANTPFFIVMLAGFGIQSGASVLVAQYHGRGNTEAINRVLGVGLYASMLLTAVVSVLAFCFPIQLMQLLTNNEELWVPGAEYARIVGFSYFFNSISGMYVGVQRSMGNPKLGAVILSASGVLNVFLNWVLIFGKLGLPALGIAGAAIATLISRILEVVAVVVFALRDTKRLPLIPRCLLRPGMVIFKDFLRYALPVICNEVLWSSATSLYSIIMGHMPNNTPILAAFTITGNLERVLSVGMFAAGSAASIIIGNEIGRGSDRDRLYGKGVALDFLAFLTGCVGCLLTLFVRFFLAKPLIFPLMGLSPEAQEIALFMLIVVAVIQPLRATNLTTIVGILRGGGDVTFALLLDILPMYLLCVPLAALAGLVFQWGIIPVYLFMFSDDLAKFIPAFWRLRSGRWINNVTREI